MEDIQKQIMELVKKADVPDPVHYVDYAVEELAKEKLNNFIRTCDYCEECRAGTKSLVAGNPHAAVMIIGEYVLESQTGADFVTPYEGTEEGELVKSILDELHVNPKQLLWMNVVNCFTHKEVNGKILKRAPKTAERENCQVYIDYAIDAFKPLYILLLGNIAMNVFQSGTIGRDRGNWFAIRDNIAAMPTYSPTTIIQMQKDDNEFATMFLDDFKKDIKTLFLDIQEQHPDSDVLLEKINE